MPITQHLEDLRSLLMHIVGALLVGFLACWTFAPQIFDFLSAPIHKLLPEGQKLAFFAVTDPFVVYAKVAALAGVFLTWPYVLYRIWWFIRPALKRKERLFAVPFVLVSNLFFVGGAAFAYYVAFPFGAEFLLTLGERFQAVISVQKYLGFLMTIVLGLGLMFQLPMVIFLLSWMGLVTPGFLIRHFRWAVLLIFITAAVITPTPDIFNLCIFAVPAIGLYLLGVAAAAVVVRKKKKASA
jgi:sec-independent protein translocase protein TatC